MSSIDACNQHGFAVKPTATRRGRAETEAGPKLGEHRSLPEPFTPRKGVNMPVDHRGAFGFNKMVAEKPTSHREATAAPAEGPSSSPLGSCQVDWALA